MMCLWRVTTLSRILLLHIALSWPPPQNQNGTSCTVQAHSIPSHSLLFRSSTTNRNDFISQRRRSNHNGNNNNGDRHLGGHRYYSSLGRITLPPISSPLSLIQQLLDKVQKTRNIILPSVTDQKILTKDDIDDHHSSNTGVMATSSITDDSQKVEVVSSLYSKIAPSFQNDDDDNSDIFYRNDDDYFESSSSSSSSNPLNYNNLRRRTMWWCVTTDDNENEELPQQTTPPPPDHNTNQISATHTHPSLEIVQDVIRIKVRSPKKVNSATTPVTSYNEQYIESLTQPLMTESVWDQLTGTEWCCSTSDDETVPGPLLEALAAMGERVARIDTPTQWIDWQVHSSSSTTSSSSSSSNHPNDNDWLDNDDAVQVWTGKCIATPPPKRQSTSDTSDDHHHNPPSNDQVEEKYLGIQLPFIKVRAILPYSVTEVVDLLLDSNKVVTYNPWSLGRKDCWIDTTSSGSKSSTGTTTHTCMTTKIVQNRVQPPIPGARQVVSTTLLHARPIRSTSESDNDSKTTSWIIVSRSIGKNHIYDDTLDSSKTSRSDILLGVNLLEPIRSKDGTILESKCRITTVTHVYSPSVPMAFAERLGVQSSIKFIHDIRNLKTKSTHNAADTANEKVQEAVKVTN